MPHGYKERSCPYCQKTFRGNGKNYCSYRCSTDAARMEKVKLWLEGKSDGRRGKTATGNYIKWYLIQERGEKCELCGWCEINQHTGNIPIELEHVDGDFTNNNIENLKLICPNCHSLTKTYKSLNKGKGRPR